ncbi:MAG: hypothetical protein ACFFG0_03750 [Candidatus Thorarchaeota archaeon]
MCLNKFPESLSTFNKKEIKFNYKCPDCRGCYNEPKIDIGLNSNSTGNPRCPFCGRRHAE